MSYKHRLSKLINNFVAFQIGWLACAMFHDGRAVVIVAGLLTWLYFAEPWSKVRIRVTIQIALLGILMDICLTYLGIYYFPAPSMYIPFWLVLLWFLFASTLSVSLHWMMSKSLYAFIGGAIIGPAAYFGGHQFEAMEIVEPSYYFVISIVWGCMMIVFSILHRKQPNNRIVLSRVSD
ncbi:MAG: DUF2878 domain-containing protein [Gammaproteobacteria bacterium]|nr:DUF2878 domain-containing protein [Gammaproteobacteria bacterium]